MYAACDVCVSSVVCDNAGLCGDVPAGVSFYSACGSTAMGGTSLGVDCPTGELFPGAHIYSSVRQPFAAKELPQSDYVFVIQKITLK